VGVDLNFSLPAATPPIRLEVRSTFKTRNHFSP